MFFQSRVFTTAGFRPVRKAHVKKIYKRKVKHSLVKYKWFSQKKKKTTGISGGQLKY